MQAQRTDVDTILDAYIECALWSSTDDAGEALDASHDADDLAPETLAAMRADVEDFLHHADPRAIEFWATELGDAQIGHDFWLTRNGHGAGFWDRFANGLGASYGNHLTEKAKPYGTVDLYIGDDAKVWGS